MESYTVLASQGARNTKTWIVDTGCGKLCFANSMTLGLYFSYQSMSYFIDHVLMVFKP